jgi:hypothetical protein
MNMKAAANSNRSTKRPVARLRPSLFQRLASWRKLNVAQVASNACQFDTLDLDQRVRLSGEW